MPCLENGRHERFAQFIAQGVKKQDAYEQAGFKVGSVNANKLFKQFPEINKRIKELQNKRARKMREADEIDIMDKTEASKILSEMARDKQNGSENGRRLSLVVLARMYGWNEPEVLEVKNANEMSDEELERMIRDKKRELDEEEGIAEAFSKKLSQVHNDTVKHEKKSAQEKEKRACELDKLSKDSELCGAEQAEDELDSETECGDDELF